MEHHCPEEQCGLSECHGGFSLVDECADGVETVVRVESEQLPRLRVWYGIDLGSAAKILRPSEWVPTSCVLDDAEGDKIRSGRSVDEGRGGDFACQREIEGAGGGRVKDGRGGR